MEIIRQPNGQYAVASETTDKVYLVSATGCECKHHQFRGVECKHMIVLKEHLSSQTPLARAAEKAEHLTDAQLERYSREHNGSAAGCACLLERACRQRSAEQDAELKRIFS